MATELYKCEECGALIEVLRGEGLEFTCDGHEMTLVTENSVDAAREKHVPIIEKTAQGFKVMVGSVPHPMIETHWIEWIELVADGISYRKFLDPGDAPEAEFCISAKSVSARESCNVHGIWIGEQNND